MDPVEALPAHPFTSREAAGLGLTRARLRQLVDDGLVRRVLRGVYVSAEVKDTISMRARAASLVVPSDAVLCDRSAAWLHGIDALWLAEHDVVPVLDTHVLPDVRRPRRAELYGGQRDLSPHDVMEIDGVRVTTPLRTALDLGCLLPRRDALGALDSFMRVHALTRDDLKQQIPRYFRRRGVRQLRSLVALADPRSESPGESRTRLEIIDSCLPTPQLQWRVTRNGREVYRLDLAYPGLKICVEYDGEEFHDSDEARHSDDVRRQWLRDHGWIVIVVRKGDFAPDRLPVWIEELRRAIASRQVTRRLRPGRRTPA